MRSQIGAHPLYSLHSEGTTIMSIYINGVEYHICGGCHTFLSSKGVHLYADILTRQCARTQLEVSA